MNKKAMEMSMNTIIIAVIALIVLLVVALIFKSHITNVANSFLGIEDTAENEGDEAKIAIGDIFKCQDGDERTVDEQEQVCEDGKWKEK